MYLQNASKYFIVIQTRSTLLCFVINELRVSLVLNSEKFIMYQFMQAHPVTLIIVMAAMMVTPFYVLATYAFSGTSLRKGLIIGSVFLVWGACMAWVCLAELPKQLGPLGALVVPICWFTPSIILLLQPSWFLPSHFKSASSDTSDANSPALSQRWLIGLQVWRVIGSVFLIEMTRGYIPGIFAYPAGLGDIAVGLFALFVLIRYRNLPQLPNWSIVAVAILGILDFLSAFFFGFTSTEGPGQLFHPEIINNTLQFPTGLIPLFLVPYAIFFHTLSLLQLRRNHH